MSAPFLIVILLLLLICPALGEGIKSKIMSKSKRGDIVI